MVIKSIVFSDIILPIILILGCFPGTSLSQDGVPHSIQGLQYKTTTDTNYLSDSINNPFSLQLSGKDWWIHEDTDGKGVEQGMPTANVSGPGWIPATVPGNIQSDMEDARLIWPYWFRSDDPLLADPNKWEAKNSWNRRDFTVFGGDPRMADVARKDWWYRKDFVIPQLFEGKQIKLIFDGVDHECEVWVNGKKIGNHAGMYRQVGYDISSSILPGKINHLAVRILRMPPSLDEYIGMPSQIKVYRHELSEIKFPSFGLDWGLGVYTLGIWKDVRLEVSSLARIDDVQVQTHLNKPWRKATVVARLEIESHDPFAVTARFRIEGHKSEVNRKVFATLSPGINQIEVSLDLEQPALWWPSGQGDQPLYQLVSELVDAEGMIIHKRITRFGVRNINWVQVEDMPGDEHVRSQLVVNGRKVRLLGTNFIPVDLLPGRQQAKAERLLRMAHTAGMNAVRLWSGVPMHDEWYDLADELGIVIEQEMPATNSGEPWPDEYSSYTAAMERTAISMIKQLRNHPCIVEWTGGNEMGWPANDPTIPSMLGKLVDSMDGRIFRVTDPVSGWRHGPYDATPEEFYKIYNEPIPVRWDEFGAPTPANIETWYRDIPPSSQWPLRPDDPVLVTKNIFLGWMRNTWLQPHVIKSQFGSLPNLPSLVMAGMWISADQLRYSIDAIRRAGPRTGGFMNWAFNEPWSNGAGNMMVDYDGRPMMKYYFAKQALAPVSLSLKFESLLYEPDEEMEFEVWLTSDLSTPVKRLSWKMLARDRHGKIFATRQGKANINPRQAQRLEVISLMIPKEALNGPIFIETQLLDNDSNKLQDRLQIFSSQSLSAPFRSLLSLEDKQTTEVAQTTIEASSLPVRVEGGQEILRLVVKNSGNMTALFCLPHPLIDYRTDLFIDQGECFVPPGESRTITIRSGLRSDGGLTLAQTGWRLTCWNAIDVTIEPSDDVLLALGRRDAMCREFDGYKDPGKLANEATVVKVEGTRPDPSQVPYLLNSDRSVQFEFELNGDQIEQPSILRLHTADQSKEVSAMVEVTLNGTSIEQSLPEGLGFQKTNPAHLASPATLTFQFPKEVLRPGKNTLQVRIKNKAWFSWDAMELRAHK